MKDLILPDKISNEIRQRVADGEIESIQILLLNENQLDLLSRIDGVATSEMVSDALGIRMNEANKRLERLRRGGYLIRSWVASKNHGKSVYEYTKIIFETKKTFVPKW
jgi:predicted transcriptional regulator